MAVVEYIPSCLYLVLMAFVLIYCNIAPAFVLNLVTLSLLLSILVLFVWESVLYILEFFNSARDGVYHPK